MKRRTLATLAGAAVLTTALVAGGAIAASATTLSTSGSAGSANQCSVSQHLLSIVKALPDNLKADLKAAHALPKGQQRADALKTIRAKALDGTYGADIQARAEKVHGRAFASFGKLPDNLKSDLKAVKSAAPADRPALVKKIGENALAGGYGDAIKTAAEGIQSSTFWQDCVAH